MSRGPDKLDQLFGIDLRSLAALRIGMGVMLLVDLALRLPNLRAHYTEAGVVPRETLQSLIPRIVPYSLHYQLSDSPLAVGVLFALA